MRLTNAVPELLCLGASLLLSGCSPLPAQNPFESSSMRGGEGRSYFVQFEVSCTECMVTWSVAGKNGRVNESGGWNHGERVWVRRGRAEVARLTASGEMVRAVRIHVDGKLAAGAGDDGPSTPDRFRSRSVEASVAGPAAGSPLQGPPPPSKTGDEGRGEAGTLPSRGSAGNRWTPGS